MKHNTKKATQLGMPIGTASNRLKKMIMFALLATQGLDVCHQCSNKILTVDELSVEHKEPWLDSEDPVRKFFDLANISFSHLNCNIAAARKVNKLQLTDDERATRKREKNAISQRKIYTSERRRTKYLKHGY